MRLANREAVGGAENWAVAITRAARGLEESLASPERLRDLTDQLSVIAERAGADMVTGSSPLGNQLAGSIVRSSARPLALWVANGARGTVLIVEGVLASGAQLTAAARRARAAGAARVVGAAVLGVPAGLAMCREELGDDVAALEELSIAE
jgi:hypothetical protein